MWNKRVEISSEQIRIKKLLRQQALQLNSQATPRVAREFEINEDTGQVSNARTVISLFKQPRRSLIDLKRESPKDRFIEELVAIKEGSYEQRLHTATLEVVYSNLPKDLWGSERAHG